MDELQQVLNTCKVPCPASREACLARAIEIPVSWESGFQYKEIFLEVLSILRKEQQLVLLWETKERQAGTCPEPHGKNNISASAPGERPPSAMVPSILISKSGDMLVIGGAGGAWIISATTMVSETHSKLSVLSALPDF